MERVNIQGIDEIDKNPMLCDMVTISHKPTKIIMDFKNMTMQFNTQSPIAVITHKVVIFDPYTAKDFLNVLQSQIQKYEKVFGEIQKPKEEDIGKAQETKIQTPFYQDYMG